MGSSNDFDRLGPVLKEGCQDVESLVHLAVRVDQVRVVHGQDVIDAYIDVNSSKTILVLQERYLDGWHVAESSLLCNTLDDLTTVFH